MEVGGKGGFNDDAYAAMIVSGSHTPGVKATDFRLPTGTALRFERAAEALRPVLSTYAARDSDAVLWAGAINWRLPSRAQIWISLDAGPIEVTTRRHPAKRMGSAALFGVTGRAQPILSSGGVSVVIDIGPIAWARLFAPSGETMRDRITPLADLLPAGWSDDLIATVARSDRGAQLKAVLDDYFAARMPPPHPDEPLIAEIAALLRDGRTISLPDAAAQSGIDARLLLRLTKRYFGFPPKLLLMRARFLRALIPMLLSDAKADFAAVPLGYHDVPHFIRDASHFLGMTPRRFLANEMPFTRAALRAHGQVMQGSIAGAAKR